MTRHLPDNPVQWVGMPRRSSSPIINAKFAEKKNWWLIKIKLKY
jgi:hypothetical protein